jgi:hypothetical protein
MAHKEDTMSYIEKKLEKAEEKAEQLWKEVYQPEEKETDKPEEVAETPEPETPEVVADETPQKEEPVAEVKEVVTPPKEEVKSDIDWKQKYQTLDGKYKAEVPRLSAEVGQWKDYAESLTRRISELEETVKKPPKEESDPEMDSVAEVNPEVAKLIKKMKEEHRDEIAKLRKELETGISADIKSVKDDIQLSKQDRFDLAMREYGAADWRQVDQDPEFLEWLNAPVPYTKATKLDLLRFAARDLDAKTLSQFFLDFKASKTPPEPDGNTEPQPDKLNKFTAPPRSGGPTPPNKASQTGLTKTQYIKFMNPRYRFNPNDWGGKTEAQVEALFDAAILKGTLV